MGSEGGRENSEGIEQGRVGQRAPSYTRTPRHVQCRCSQVPAASERARAAFSERTRDAKQTAREYARGQGLDWDSLDPARQVAMLKGGTKASRKAKAHDLGDFVAWRREVAALGWWHASVLGQAPAPERSREKRLKRACEVARAVGQAAAAARRGGRGRGAGRGGAGADRRRGGGRAGGHRCGHTRLRRARACARKGKPSGRSGPCRGCAGPGKGALTTTLHVKRETELIGLAQAAPWTAPGHPIRP